MIQQPIRDALKQVAGYGVKKFYLGFFAFAIVLNGIVSALAMVIAADGAVWKPIIALLITAIAILIAGTLAAIHFAIGSTLQHGIVKADLVRVTVNAIFDRFGIDQNIGISRREFDNHLSEAVEKLSGGMSAEGKLSWVAERVRIKILTLSTARIVRIADNTFRESERVSLQTFRDNAADRINTHISTTIKRGVIAYCSTIIAVGTCVAFGISLMIRLM